METITRVQPRYRQASSQQRTSKDQQKILVGYGHDQQKIASVEEQRKHYAVRRDQKEAHGQPKGASKNFEKGKY